MYKLKFEKENPTHEVWNLKCKPKKTFVTPEIGKLFRFKLIESNHSWLTCKQFYIGTLVLMIWEKKQKYSLGA